MPFLRGCSTFALALALGAPAAATTISFQNGFGGYGGADNESYSFDGTISQDQIRLDLPSASQPEGSYAWLIFEGIVGPGAVPAGAAIVSATLEGLVRNPFDVAHVARLLDGIESRPFGPGADIRDAAGVFYDAALVSASHPACADAVVCDPPAPIAWDVTALVQAWVDGAANHGFLLLPETVNGGKLFATDDPDAALRPRLVIEYGTAGAPVPEPALFTLLVLAFVLAAARR